jgi:formate C-acetyltransferase
MKKGGNVMYQNVPISERVQAIRAMYRSKKPKIDINRYRIVTEFYMANPQLPGSSSGAESCASFLRRCPRPCATMS